MPFSFLMITLSSFLPSSFFLFFTPLQHLFFSFSFQCLHDIRFAFGSSSCLKIVGTRSVWVCFVLFFCQRPRHHRVHLLAHTLVLEDDFLFYLLSCLVTSRSASQICFVFCLLCLFCLYLSLSTCMGGARRRIGSISNMLYHGWYILIYCISQAHSARTERNGSN